MVKRYGWIKKERCGCAEKGLEWHYSDLRSLCGQLLKENVLSCPIANFGRFNQASMLVTLSIALTFYDADIQYGGNKKQDIGILGTSPDGALDSNLTYFRDYAEAGRKLGRGNLFIYTLPSSPLAEAAIHFGLQGPLIYIRHTDKPEQNLLAQAELMIKNNDAHAMVAIAWSTNEATCHFISGEGV